MAKTEKRKPAIIKFQKKDAAKLAELFNAFDHEGLWPGGFTGGIPYTAARILDSWPVAFKYISILISTYEGKFTGICSLHPHYEDKEASYIGLLGVHPDFLGKGHGKALILESLKIATEKNLKRVDLHTWAGNLRAVPLYKKCGMFWVPETSVEMHDHIPGILNFPLAKPFFEKHDWYSTQIRSLTLKPDKHQLGEMEVFIYEFAEDGDHCQVWVDRYGRGILGIERTLNNQRIKILAQLEDHAVIAGTEYKLAITLENGTATELVGSIFLAGFEGLTFTSQPTRSFKISSKDSIQLQAQFKVNPEVEVPDIHRKQKTINANLIINGKLLPLEIGLRILPLLTFKTTPKTIAVTAGTAGTILFSVFNNATQPFSGRVFIIDELKQLSLSTSTFPLEIPPKSHSGFDVGFTVNQHQPTQALPLKLLSTGTVGDAEVDTQTNFAYVKCLNPGDIALSEEQTEHGKAVIVESDDLVTTLRVRRASMDIIYKDAVRGRQKLLNACRFEVGPPFGFKRPLSFDYAIERKPEGVEVVFSAFHPDKPGIKMARILTFYRGTSIIKEKIRIVNMNPETSYQLKAQLCRTNGVRAHHYTLILPLDKIRKHEMIEFPASESDLPTDPAAYHESWVCFHNHPSDYSFGFLWSTERMTKIKFGDFPYVLAEYDLGTVSPGHVATTPDFYYVVRRGNWHGIRRKWEQLIQQKLASDVIPQAHPLFNIRVAENTLLAREPQKVNVEVTNFRNKKQSGKLTLHPPPGWTITPSELQINEVAAKHPFSATVTASPPSQVTLGIHSGKIRFSSLNQRSEYPLTLCVLADTARGNISVLSTTEARKRVFTVSNGVIDFKASAEFGGCLYFLGKDQVNQLATTFPEFQTKVFLENYSGGIRSLWVNEERFDLQKSRTHDESYTAKIVEESPWKGVKFSYHAEKQDELRGLHGSISYLTLPRSNLVKIRREFRNPTLANFHFTNCLWLSPNVGGDFEKNEVIYPRGHRIWRFRRSKGFPVAGVTPENGWITVRNDEKNVGLTMLSGDTRQSDLFSLDLGNTLLELFIVSRIHLPSHGSSRIDDYIVLDSGVIEDMDKLAKALRRSFRE